MMKLFRQASQLALKHPQEIRENVVIAPKIDDISFEEYQRSLVTAYVCSLSVYLTEPNTMACKIPTEKLMELGIKYKVIPHNEALLVALLYMKKLVTKLIAVAQDSDARQLLTRLSAYQIFSLCLLMSLKILEDNPFNNESFARLCGIQLSLLNKMELAFLVFFDFNVHVTAEEFDRLTSAI